ncbi:MAG: hypothetical protein HYT28_00640 [Parcubacteria group bacterium]|nr:hypothetical protein [Parcubacteria group bacterium]
MANLLPQESQKNIRKEYRLRLAATALFFLSALIFFAGVLLVPSLLLSSVKVTSSKEQLALLQNKEIERAEEEMKTLVLNTNADIALMEEGSAETPVIGELIKYLLDTKPDSIAITGIFYEKAKNGASDNASLRGIALNREALFSYITFLQGNGYFTEAAVPVSRLVKEKDIDFTIPLKMKPRDKQSKQ